jgi:hypothetical protein
MKMTAVSWFSIKRTTKIKEVKFVGLKVKVEALIKDNLTKEK